jgi:hypothetical protein
MPQPFMFGHAASNEILEAAAKLDANIGALLQQASFAQLPARLGATWSEEQSAGLWALLTSTRDDFHAMFGNKQAAHALLPWRVFGFITDASRVNGLATRLFDPKAQAYYLGISAGALVQPYLMHARLAAQASYFPEIPETGARRAVQLEDGTGISLAWSRHMLATTLARVSAYLVFFHELAHILRGHIAHINDDGAIEAPHVLDAPLVDGEVLDLARRSLETDADFQAGIWLGEFFINRPHQLKALGRDAAEQLPRIMMAVLVTFHRFGATARYHDGVSRAYVVLAGILSTQPGGAQGAAAFAVPMMDEFIGTMQEAGVQVDDLSLADLADLLAQTEPQLAALQEDFVGMRPARWAEPRQPRKRWLFW